MLQRVMSALMGMKNILVIKGSKKGSVKNGTKIRAV
jgi:hypothetical protein